MKNKTAKCAVQYERWQLQCCGDPITVGKVADLVCVKDKRRKNYVGIEIDYYENHHGYDVNCCVRGLVTRIQAICVEKFAKSDGQNYHIDNPDNEFSIIDTDYIDGSEICEKYGHRYGGDVIDYIITLEDVIERPYEKIPENGSNGKYILIEPGDEGKELFWDEEGEFVGDTDSLSYYKGKDKQVIDLTTSPWHEIIVKWRNEYLEHIDTGYSVWSNDNWLDWWCVGYCIAKQVRQLLPSDIILVYGLKGQCRQVIAKYGNNWELNIESHRISISADMKQKADAGLFIPRTYLDWLYEENHQDHKFVISHSEHHLFPGDRVMLCVYGRPAYQLGTVVQVNEESIIINTDRWLDISEEYSIELIV